MNNQDRAGGERVWKVLSHRQQNLEDCDFWLEVTDGKTSLLSHMDDEQTMQDIANVLNDTGASIYIDKSDEAAACHVAGYLEGENKRLSQQTTTLQGEVERLKKGSVDWLLSLLPERTYNCEPFGLIMMPCNRDQWAVCYYSFYSNKDDSRLGQIVAHTLPGALLGMYQKFQEVLPEALNHEALNPTPHER